MAKRTPKGDYKVGYAKPPQNGKFRRGRSGNPRGRPKGSRNKGSIVRNVMDRKVIVRENGRQREMTVSEVLVEKMVSKALDGSMSDQIKLIQLVEKYMPEKFEDIPDDVARRITVEFVKSDGNGRPANREHFLDWQWERHWEEVRERNRHPEVVAAWKAAGFDDDEDEQPSMK